jgi:hypothetical protein
MSLQDTKHKLYEASFILDKVKSSIAENPDVLSYYLSAFVSAGRSVTLVMQKTFVKKNPKYKKWYAKKKSNMIRNKTFVLFENLRNLVIHKEGRVQFQVNGILVIK